MRRVALTPIARDRLLDIIDWTFQTFGPRQAVAYEEEILRVFGQIESETALIQNCALLMAEGTTTPLKFTRAGRHFVIFLEYDDKFAVVDLLHSSSDLAAQLELIDNPTTNGESGKD